MILFILPDYNFNLPTALNCELNLFQCIAELVIVPGSLCPLSECMYIHVLHSGPFLLMFSGSTATNSAMFSFPVSVSEGTREPVMGEVTEKRNTFKKMVKNFHQIRTRCKVPHFF